MQVSFFEGKDMRIPYCMAEHHVIETWLEEHCKEKNCPHLVFVCQKDLILWENYDAD
jgi:hypothetical protein